MPVAVVPLQPLRAPHLQREWLADSKGLPAMSGQLFFHAVFELIGACPLSLE